MYIFKALCIDIHLKWLSSCSVVKEKEHIHVKLTHKAWKILDKLTVKILSTYIRHVFNWHCVLDCAVSDRPKNVYLLRYPCPIDLIYCLVTI